MLPTHGVKSMSRTVAHGYRSEKISVGKQLSRGLCGCLTRPSSNLADVLRAPLENYSLLCGRQGRRYLS